MISTLQVAQQPQTTRKSIKKVKRQSFAIYNISEAMANKLLVDFAYKSNACMRKILKRVHCGGFDYNTENIDSKRQYNLNVGLINIDLKRSFVFKDTKYSIEMFRADEWIAINSK